MWYERFFLLIVCVFISFGASALTGSEASPLTPLDTVSPTLDSAAAVTDDSVSAMFSKPMRVPGVMDAGNYAVSGLGVGTLAPAPSEVSGGPSEVTLDWAAGEMRDGVTLTLTVLDVQDALGNPIHPDANSASFPGMGTAPVFSDLQVMPSRASAGDTVTITFTVSEPLQANPEVTVNGQAATHHAGGKAVDYTYTYEVQESDAVGMATIQVSGADLAGNVGALSNNDALEILEPEIGLPLFGWPWLAALLLALGLCALTRGRLALECGGPASAFSFAVLSRCGWRRTRTASSHPEQESQSASTACALHNANARKKSVLFFALLYVVHALACSSAFAQGPEVTNVTMVQSATDTSTQVDIYYDLNAPNGPCDITVTLSKDGGDDGYPYLITSITGDLTNVTTGTNHHIVWDIRADYPEEDLPLARVLVTADDGFALFTLTYTAGPNGSIDGDSPQQVVEGQNGASVEAVPDTGCHFVQWSDGVTDNPRQDMNVAEDISVEALFEINTYTLTYLAGENGSISGPTTQTINHGEDGDAVTAVGDGVYVFGQWSDGSIQNPRTDTNVAEDITVTASFGIPPVVTAFVINNDDVSTDSRAVTLNNTTANSPAEYMASESADFSGAVWQPYDIAPTFTLHDGTAITRTVYFKARNGFGESGVVSDTIYLEPDRVSVPAGTFTMGRRDDGDDGTYGFSNELPRHEVTLSAYQLGKYQVTNQQYCDVLNWARAQGYLYSDTAGTPWTGTGNIHAGGAGARYLIVSLTSSDCNIEYTGGVFVPKTRTGLPGSTIYSMAEHPMVLVSWYGSVAFSNWLSQMLGLTPCYNMNTPLWPLTVVPPTAGGYRLPTEAEWERAAAWGETSPGSGVYKHWIYGFLSDTLTDNARATYNFNNPLGLTSAPRTSPVGWFNGVNVSPNGPVATVDSPSPVGAYDMSGNVWEWCQDWYGSYSSDPVTDPTGPTSGLVRVVRGGHWFNYARNCRSALRGRPSPGYRSDHIGFRLASS